MAGMQSLLESSDVDVFASNRSLSRHERDISWDICLATLGQLYEYAQGER